MCERTEGNWNPASRRAGGVGDHHLTIFSMEAFAWFGLTLLFYPPLLKALLQVSSVLRLLLPSATFCVLTECVCVSEVTRTGSPQLSESSHSPAPGSPDLNSPTPVTFHSHPSPPPLVPNGSESAASEQDQNLWVLPVLCVCVCIFRIKCTFIFNSNFNMT